LVSQLRLVIEYEIMKVAVNVTMIKGQNVVCSDIAVSGHGTIIVGVALLIACYSMAVLIWRACAWFIVTV
jgi:hypothetical protein